MDNIYMVGEQVRQDMSFTNPSGVLFDPTVVNVSFSYNGVGPTIWTYGSVGSIFKDAVGKYHVIFDTTNNPGTWNYAWYQNSVFVQAGLFTVIPRTV